MTEKPLNILFLAAEAVPFAKLGGLADVAGSLPKAVQALGHDVRLMIPRYGSIRSDQFCLKKVGNPLEVPVGTGIEHIHLVSDTTDGNVPTYLIWNEHYFSSRDQVYGFEDDAQRFAIFGRGALAALHSLDWKPDLIHANDWHTAIVPTWLDTAGRQDPFYSTIATLFTIHNPAIQGTTGRLLLRFAKMEFVSHLPVEKPGTVNWIAQGIAHADLVNTVSERYAKEILTPEMGMGLDPLLRERKDQFFGVLNGIDYEQWDPSTDSHLPHRFGPDTLNMRSLNKTTLQQQARLPVRPEVPLIGMVTRLDQVKGMDLMEPVLEWLLAEDTQFVLVGTGEEKYCQMLKQVQDRFPEKMHAFLKFDDVLARRIYAGADVLLVPSAVEPCGLGQMIGMHYGCIPVVRATGGLADTVTNYRSGSSRSTGFVFKKHTAKNCIHALKRALKIYHEDKTAWHTLQRRGMGMDFSWESSAKKYEGLYTRAIERCQETHSTTD